MTAESSEASVATDSKTNATVAEQQFMIKKQLPSIAGTHTNCMFNFNF